MKIIKFKTYSVWLCVELCSGSNGTGFSCACGNTVKENGGHTASENDFFWIGCEIGQPSNRADYRAVIVLEHYLKIKGVKK